MKSYKVIHPNTFNLSEDVNKAINFVPNAEFKFEELPFEVSSKRIKELVKLKAIEEVVIVTD